MNIKFLQLLVILTMMGCLNEPSETNDSETPLVQTFTSEEPPNFTENLNLLQGTWESERGVTISVNGNKYEERHKEKVKKAIVEAYSNCPNFCADKNQDVSSYPCFILKENNAAQCYVIFKLTVEELRFSTMGGKPKIRTFTKK